MSMRNDYIAIKDDGLIEFLVKRKPNQIDDQVKADIRLHQSKAELANPDEWDWEDVKQRLIKDGYEIASCEQYHH